MSNLLIENREFLYGDLVQSIYGVKMAHLTHFNSKTVWLEVKYSFLDENDHYRNGFGRQPICGDEQTSCIESLRPEAPFKAVTVKHDKLNALLFWVFYPLRRTENNWLQMRDSTCGFPQRLYLPFEVRHNSLCQSLRVLIVPMSKRPLRIDSRVYSCLQE